MNKEQFFIELEESLRGEVSDSEYRDSLSYYSDYFREQEALGRSEEEILSELGSARFIAHSIIDAHGLEHAPAGNSGYYESAGNYTGSGSPYNDPYGEEDADVVNDPQPGPVDHVFGQAGRILMIIAVLLVAGLAIRFLLPFILVIIAVVIISNMFRRM